MNLTLLRLALALAATLGAVVVFHYLRGFPWRTTLYSGVAIGAFTYVAVGTLARLRTLFRRERYRIDPE